MKIQYASYKAKKGGRNNEIFKVQIFNISSFTYWSGQLFSLSTVFVYASSNEEIILSAESTITNNNISAENIALATERELISRISANKIPSYEKIQLQFDKTNVVDYYYVADGVSVTESVNNSMEFELVAVTKIADYGFVNYFEGDIIIPSSIVSIGNHAFANCENLGMVVLLRTAEDGITDISATAFNGSDNVCLIVFDEDSYYGYYNDLVSKGAEELAEYVQFIMCSL